MKTTISKYKNKGSINLGDGLYLDLFIGMTQEGGGGDTSNIKTITSGYSEGYELQQVFSIPQGHSVIMAVRVSTMSTTYTDLLRYSCSGDTSVQNFYCDNIIYFTENKALPSIGYPVCIKAKNSPYAPSSKYTFKVLYASCGVDNITWYDNVFVNRKAYARENERLTLKNDPIDEDAETTQVLATDAQGALDGLDLQNYTDFIIDTSASSGSCTFSPASFKPDNIYRIMFSEDGEVNFTDIPNCEDVTAQVKGDSIVSIVFQEGTNGEYYIAIDQQPIDVYYTKEETDHLIDEKISEIDLSDVVHKSGAEAITGNKDFSHSIPRFTAMYIGLGYRMITYSNVGFDFEGMIQATSGSIQAEGLNSAMLVSGRAVWSALQAYLKTADIATTLDGATDDKVPSAKCVADALSEISWDDTNLVHKTGNEIIAGNKTFNHALNFYNLYGLTDAQDTYIKIEATLNSSTSKPNLLFSSTYNNYSRLITIINDEGISLPSSTINGYSLELSPGSISFKKTNSTLSIAINIDSQLQSTAPMTAPKTQLIGANDTELTRGMDVFMFVNDLLTGKANDNDVVHKTTDENITGAKTFVNTGVTIVLKRSSNATTYLALLVDSDSHPNIRRYDSGSVSQNVILKSDRIEFRNDLTTVNAYVSSNSNLDVDWNTNQLPTKTAVAAKIAEEIASANEIGAVNQSFAQGGVQDITLAQTSHYKTTYVRVTCTAQINIQVITPDAVIGDILVIDSARCEAGGVCFRPVKDSSNAGYHAFDVCENTAVTYGSTNFQTLIKWYYNGTSWQRLEKTICGQLSNVSD